VGLEVLEAHDRSALADYQPYHAARADLLVRTGDRDGAVAAYDRAIELTVNPTERGFLDAQRAVAIALRSLGP
jgi:RNA polymerase sigma-70 factor, ECF subfamily